MTHAAEEHPDLTRLREQIAAAVEHGYTEGDVNHYTQPVIGQMRMYAERCRQHGGTGLQVELRTVDLWIAQLQSACQAELAWLNPADPT